jgi:hypothetical protein
MPRRDEVDDPLNPGELSLEDFFPHVASRSEPISAFMEVNAGESETEQEKSGQKEKYK